jgi:photosystem II stability/assembly factor-like uncharacterized protein
MHTSIRWLVRFAIPLLVFPLIVAAVAPQGQGGGLAGRERAINQSTDPLLASFRFRSIGPASMGGRIDDIAVSESDPNVIYVGYATGGVFKSENNGTTFAPVFETYGTASIGDIAIHPANPNIVYIGTGEANNRQTTSFGDGIYKTTDGGKTFTNIGLKETQSIARIVIDPRSPETVYVASPGHLFGSNPDRGIYKTIDGGKTWDKIKYIDDYTGFTDIAIDPGNSKILYAASYQRLRSGCCFNGGGPGSAIWKTVDAGKTWMKITASGLPPGTYGRIALDVSRSNPNVVYAQIEAGETGQPMPTSGVQPSAATEATPPGAAAVAGAPAAGQAGAAPQAGGGRGGGYDWCNNAGPGAGFGRGGGAQAQGNQPPQKPPALDPKRSGVLRSEDKGRSWTLVSNCNARPMYFSQLRVDPTSDKTVYVAGLPVAKSLDGGRTFATLDSAGGNASPGHVDQHAIWIDPRNPKHLIIGNDGGLDISWDQGKTWDFVNTMATALAYVITADMRHPYFVYIGLQDNGSWGGPSAVRGRGGIMNSDWFGIGGGDGFYTAVDPTDYNIVYSESQNGSANRYDLSVGRGQSIRPRGFPEGRGGRGGRGAAAPPGGQAGAQPAAAQPETAQPVQAGGAGAAAAPNVLNAGPTDQYRFNWNTPVVLSPHNPSMVWLGGNRLFKSYNRGDTWVASPDLTRQIDRSKVSMMGVAGDRTMLSKNDGVGSYGTIVSVSESPVMPGVVWAGTDDGNLQVSLDGGITFTEVGKNLPGLPPNHLYWIARIDASHFDAATAYVAVDGHRSDDLEPYVFVTHDYGKTFESITSDLPSYGNVQVIREDPKNKDLLFVGTEFGLYTTLDGGKSWKRFMNNYPTVRTDDLLVHPREGDLVVATHGRSVFIADDITPLQQFTPAVRSQDVALFDVRPAVSYLNDQQHGQQVGGQKVFVGENAPRGTAISYYLKSPASGDVKISIADVNGRMLCQSDGPKEAGINRIQWTLVAPLLAPQPAAAAGGGQAGRGGGAGPVNASCSGAGGGGGGGGRGGAGGGVEPGTYIVTLTANGKTLTRPVTVLQDRWLGEK